MVLVRHCQAATSEIDGWSAEQGSTSAKSPATSKHAEPFAAALESSIPQACLDIVVAGEDFLRSAASTWQGHPCPSTSLCSSGLPISPLSAVCGLQNVEQGGAASAGYLHQWLLNYEAYRVKRTGELPSA